MGVEIRDVSFPGFQQNSYYIADHVLEKTAASDLVNQVVALAAGSGREYSTDFGAA